MTADCMQVVAGTGVGGLWRRMGIVIKNVLVVSKFMVRPKQTAAAFWSVQVLSHKSPTIPADAKIIPASAIVKWPGQAKNVIDSMTIMQPKSAASGA